jgi:hypothetical protein
VSLIPDLEAQLRDAAAHRRERARRQGIGSLAAAVGAAVLVSSLLLIGGGDERGAGDRRAAEERRFEGPLPVGTVIPKGEGRPPRDSDSTVVATGTAPFAGAWQLEVTRDHGASSPPGEPRGRCLFLRVLDPPTYEDGTPDPSGFSGFCGGLGFRKTPGFSRAQKDVPTLRKLPSGRLFLPKEVLVYGRVPERASKVVITADRGVRIEVEPAEGSKSIRGDFFVIPVKPRMGGHARINWFDADGVPGSRGIALQPPVTKS